MLDTIRKNVLIPLLGRLGTAVSVPLAGYGLEADTAQQLPIAITVVGLVIYDLFVDWLARRGGK